ncbi:MAG: hypothetical protein A2V62_06465 [Nitrospirae bacterium RBG_19FT_COMBO_58_9]|nr:MAG: hypothetical protein A2V62_06465 [Nitrospirae bacterium RBG_19FT_COMBO_58_9]
MLAHCPPYVSIENIEIEISSGGGVGGDVTGILLETWCTHELQWVVYERNFPSVWAQVIGHLRGYLGCLWVSEALQGNKASEAFSVSCDQSTMTPDDIRNGHLICLVGVALVRPGDFTFYRIHIHQKGF